MASFGARVPLVSFLGVEGAATSSFGWLEVPTRAGRAEVSMQALTLHAAVDPWADRVASVSLGLGGGAVWTSVLGTPRPGYTDLYDSTTVGLLSARLGFALRGEHLSFVGHVEAGLLVPAVTLSADESTLAELGRPWFSALLGVGFSP